MSFSFSVKSYDRMLNKLADEAFRRTGLAPTYGFYFIDIKKKKDGIPQKDIAQMLYSRPINDLLVLLKN